MSTYNTTTAGTNSYALTGAGLFQGALFPTNTALVRQGWYTDATQRPIAPGTPVTIFPNPKLSNAGVIGGFDWFIKRADVVDYDPAINQDSATSGGIDGFVVAGNNAIRSTAYSGAEESLWYPADHAVSVVLLRDMPVLCLPYFMGATPAWHSISWTPTFSIADGVFDASATALTSTSSLYRKADTLLFSPSGNRFWVYNPVQKAYTGSDTGGNLSATGTASTKATQVIAVMQFRP